MPVAKSFVNFEQLTEPYQVGNKMYIRLRNPSTGTERQARWYTDAEYAKLYPEEKVTAVQTVAKCAREALGFSKGPITIFKGDIEGNQDWFELSNARYCTWWGWYIVSTESVPADLPTSVQPVICEWIGVGNEDGSLKTESQVKLYVNSLLYEASPSRHVGAPGERIEIELTVTKVSTNNTRYGCATLHTFEDAEGNVYMWNTTAKSWSIGEVKTIRGSIKEHITKRNVKITVLTRCVEK